MDYDGTNLWLMAEQQGILYKLNPLNGDVLSSYVISTSSDPNYYACAYDNGYLWISEYYSGHKLIKVNPLGVISF
jgi:streptogramin lyase